MVITVVLLVFGWMIERSITEHFVRQDVDELSAVVYALQHTVATLPPDVEPEELERRLTDAISGHHNAHYYISDDAGQRSEERRVGKESTARWGAHEGEA